MNLQKYKKLFGFHIIIVRKIDFAFFDHIKHFSELGFIDGLMLAWLENNRQYIRKKQKKPETIFNFLSSIFLIFVNLLDVRITDEEKRT